MANSLPVLFMTNSEYGQANVLLATALEIARDSSFQVHFASFSPFQARLKATNKSCKSLARPIVYHLIEGPTLTECLLRTTSDPQSIPHPPGFINSVRSYRRIVRAFFNWRPTEYLQSYRSCEGIMQKVKPAALVIENGLICARDAATTAGLEFIIMAPCGAKEICAHQLAGAPATFKWPMVSSGYQYPLSAVNRIKNVALRVSLILTCLFLSQIRAIGKARKKAKIDGPSPFLNSYTSTRNSYLLPFLPELDYDHFSNVKIPSNVIPCGPIIYPPSWNGKSDFGLREWVAKVPTVLINLGSVFYPTAQSILEMCKGIETVLRSRTDVQILWKLKTESEGSPSAATMLHSLTNSGRFKVTKWLDINPSDLLETGDIVCSVHHGGANSYYEACRAGIPHLVLPVWIDTYEYAERARHLGIGLIGNVGVAPNVESAQFASKLLQTLNDEVIRQRAAEIGEICKGRGEGRIIAAENVMDWARQERSRILPGPVGCDKSGREQD